MSIPTSDGAFFFPAQRAAAHIAAAYLCDSHGNVKNIDVKSLLSVERSRREAETFACKTGSAADINVFLQPS